jgi:hypothetical protein
MSDTYLEREWKADTMTEDGLTLADKAARAEWALDTYAQLAGDFRASDDYETYVVDLLADLLHLAAQKDLDFETLLARSERHFYAERDGFSSTADPSLY